MVDLISIGYWGIKYNMALKKELEILVGETVWWLLERTDTTCISESLQAFDCWKRLATESRYVNPVHRETVYTFTPDHW